MFETKKTILFITKSKIKIARVTLGRKPKEEMVVDVNWTPDTLADILFKYKKEIKGSARILLSEDFVYTVNITLSSGSTSREDIKKAAQEFIPEDLDQTIWDFKETGSSTKIQVIAASKLLIGVLKTAVAKAELQIEAIEPLSFALARFGKAEDGPVVYVYRDDNGVLLTLAQRGIAIATEHLGDIDLNTLNQFLAFAQRFSAAPKNVIFCGNTSGIDPTSLQNVSFKTQVLNISPIISLAYKEDIKGKDEQVLNLELLKTFTPGGRQNKAVSVSPTPSPTVKKHNFSKTTILAVFLLIAIVILIALIFFKVYL